MTTTDTLRTAAIEVAGVLAEPFASPESRTWWPALLLTAAVAVLVEARRRGGPGLLRRALGVALWRERSAALDVQLLAVRQLLRFLGLLRVGSALGLGVVIVGVLDRALGRPAPPTLPAWLLVAGYSVVLFVVGDLSRFLVHRLSHRVPLLWAFHKVHHSATVLTPLSFHRIHPVESLLLDLRGVVVTGTLGGLAFWLWRGEATVATVLGVEAIGLLANVAMGNLRHSHVWLPFPAWAERWILSPAQHQVHHGARPLEHMSNYGTWLACWDRLGGSLRLAGDRPPAAFGLPDRARNHEQELLSALLQPFRVVPRMAALLPIAAPVRALAGEDEVGGEEIVVEARRPVIGGAAHEISEETLERYEHDDIHRVLATVPGVYVRGEDGFGLRPNIGMRGAASDRSAKITLLEDGVPLAPAPYAAPAAYYFPLTTRLTGVEVFKGPSAIAHGPQTIGGAVNLLTRAVPPDLRGAVDLAMGPWSTVKVHGWGGTTGKAVGFLLEGAHVGSGGFKQLDGGGPTGFDRQDLLAKGRLHLGGSEFTLKLGYGRERSYETYLGLTLADFEENPYRRYAASQRDVMEWQHTQESLAWTLLAGDTLVVRTVAYHNWLDRSWTKLNGFAGEVDLHDLLLAPDAGQAATYVAILRGEEDSAVGDQTLRVGTNARTFHNFGLQSVARHFAGGKKVTNTVELGVRAHADDVLRVHTEEGFSMQSGVLVPTGEPTETTLDHVGTAHAIAAWVRDDLGVGVLHAAPGVRVENVRTAAGTRSTGPGDPQWRTEVLPGIALSAEAKPWLVAYGGVHRGFSPVTPGEAADVAPETAWNGELGVRAFPGRTWAEVTGFGSRYDNLHGTCTISAGCGDAQAERQYNGGEVLVAGVESAVAQSLDLPRNLTLEGRLAYTFTWSAFQSDFVSGFPQWGTVAAGDALPYVPVHQGAGELSLRGNRGSVSLGATWRGEMRDVAGQGAIADDERIPAALTLDLAAEAKVTRYVTGYVAGRNLTGAATVESLRPFGARPGAPFTILAGVKVTPAAPDEEHP